MCEICDIAGDHQHGGAFDPSNQEGRLFRLPRPRRVHFAAGHPRVLHHVPGGNGQFCRVPGHADRPRTHLHRAVERRVRGQRRRGRAA